MNNTDLQNQANNTQNEQAANTQEGKVKVHKNVFEAFVSGTASRLVHISKRIGQKKDKIIQSVPVLKKLDSKWLAYDRLMTQRHGYVYTKIRDSIKNTARTVAAYEFFGIPGMVAMCAYKTGEKLYGIMKPAYDAVKRGESDSVLSYLKQNRNETRFTLTSGSLSIANTVAKCAGAQPVVDAIRVGKASLLAAPELKNLGESICNWAFHGGTSKEVARDAAILGITVATYFADDAPMTRGKGKPLNESKEPQPTIAERIANLKRRHSSR
ncbi:MAG: hypothetical protein MJ247_07180 [Alphaproteobacteria bacterium]|nr:hypothetical protein [Alphaproteobacteria bacterium]